MYNNPPKNWKIYKLKELYDIKRGSSPRPIEKFLTTDPDGINWIKIGDAKIDSKYIEETKEKITVEGAAKSRFVEEGDFILSNSMSFGRPYIMKTRGCIHDGWLVLKERQDGLIFKDFMYYILSSENVYSQFKNAAAGGVVSNLNIQRVENVIVPIPPTLAEQQEIVQVLDTMSDIIRLREECISHAQDLIPALFQEMFDNPQTNKKNWQICCLKDLAKIDRQNISPEELKTKQYTYIGLEHIEKETGRILVDPNSQQDIDLKSNKFFFTNNHVLYGKLRPYLNKVALPDFDGVCSTDIFPLLPLEGISNKYFLKVLMNTSYFVNMANSQSSGANLPRIGTTALENIKVFKPDYTLQEQFAQKVIEIEAYIKEQQEEFANAKQMFQSLLHHAFTGELTRHKFGGDANG